MFIANTGRVGRMNTGWRRWKMLVRKWQPWTVIVLISEVLVAIKRFFIFLLCYVTQKFRFTCPKRTTAFYNTADNNKQTNKQTNRPKFKTTIHESKLDPVKLVLGLKNLKEPLCQLAELLLRNVTFHIFLNERSSTHQPHFFAPQQSLSVQTVSKTLKGFKIRRIVCLVRKDPNLAKPFALKIVWQIFTSNISKWSCCSTHRHFRV